MLGTVILFGILAGVDNLQACSAIGLLPLHGARRCLLALAFTVCETAAPLAGLAVGNVLLRWTGSAGPKLGPLLTLACGIAILIFTFRGEAALVLNHRKWVFGMPVALSCDNLLAGTGLSSLHYPLAASALVIGFISAAMSCIGLYSGAWVRRFLPRWMEFAVGVYLCALAGHALSIGRV